VTFASPKKPHGTGKTMLLKDARGAIVLFFLYD